MFCPIFCLCSPSSALSQCPFLLLLSPLRLCHRAGADGHQLWLNSWNHGRPQVIKGPFSGLTVPGVTTIPSYNRTESETPPKTVSLLRSLSSSSETFMNEMS